MGSKEESSVCVPPTPQGQMTQLGFRTTATKDSDTASSISSVPACCTFPPCQPVLPEWPQSSHTAPKAVTRSQVPSLSPVKTERCVLLSPLGPLRTGYLPVGIYDVSGPGAAF